MINHIIQIISQDKSFQRQSTTLFYVKIQSPNKHIYTDTQNRDQFIKTKLSKTSAVIKQKTSRLVQILNSYGSKAGGWGRLS